VTDDAVRQYKELVAANDEAINRMRAHDLTQVEQLRKQLSSAQYRLNQATDKERLARQVITGYWESSVEELWKERWLSPGLPPQPLPVDPELDAQACDAEVERSYDALHEALRRQPLIPPLKSRHKE
jgi:hypothetical protein